jgi:uncharacterized protein (TIGR02145 family)
MKKQLFTVCLALTALFLITCEKTEPVTKITTDNVTVTGATSASIEGELGEQAQFGNIQYGICYDSTPNPTITDNKIELNNPKTTFTAEIGNLEQNTKYYVRSFCCNGDEITYGNQLTFTTFKSNPVLTTTPVTYTTGSEPTSGGNITSDGGAPITARGVCWATTTNPTTANRKTTDGTGTGTYTSTLTRIVDGITYYVRAYATNSNGTFYGNEQVFNGTKPVLTTATTTKIMATTAYSGGTVIAGGGSTVTALGVCWATTTNPTTADSKTTDGSGIGTFTSNLTGLTASTTYYVRAYATNSGGTGYGNQQTFTTNGPGEPLTDIDGNTYNTVWIGGKLWMAENLKTTRYNDGTAIPEVTDNNLWMGLTTGAYCWYNNDVANKDIYGALYNWYTVNTGKLAPTGWHVPSDAEWTNFVNYLEPTGHAVGGGKLKETGTAHWLSPNTGATNEFGFTALPGGSRNSSSVFGNVGYLGYWWSSTAYGASKALNRDISYYTAGIFDYCCGYDNKFGSSIRCMRD